MRRFFPFRSFTSNAGNDKPAPAHDKRNENILDEGGTNGASHSPDTRAFRSRSRHEKPRSEESPNPQLRRCLSFTATAIDRSLDERAMSFSSDIPCSMLNTSDTPRHVADVECYSWSPERHPNIGEYMIKVPKGHDLQETDSPRSRGYSCSSTGHSPLGSPIALKCRPARLTNLLHKNEVLDLLENEKTHAQTTLELELDRRSNDWSAKLAKFQSEEQRLRDRVMELAEQNVSFQREVTLLESNSADASNRIKSLELQNKQLNDEPEKVMNEHNDLYRTSVELHDSLTKAAEERDKIQECLAKAAEERDQIQECLKSREDNSRALHKVIARLQRASNEQEKTITGLRQGFSAELEKRSVGSSESINRTQLELLRLTGVEQKLRKEIQSCALEVESLRQENIGILNRLQSSGSGLSLSSLRLEQELNARVDNLQIQGLSLLDDSSRLCGKLLDVMKSKSENVGSVDALEAIEYTLKYQNIKEGMDNLALGLRKIKSLLVEKFNEEDSTMGIPSRPDTSSRDDLEIKLKEEALLNRVLKEKLLSRELEIEQLQSDIASLGRIQDVMQNEIHRAQDELCCMTHKSKCFEVELLKKDDSINQIQQEF
uniref:Uncharacterized protein n=1 Tax=Avena sativa TaxID=4498 RepID=A0ACD5XPM8_AVESA